MDLGKGSRNTAQLHLATTHTSTHTSQTSSAVTFTIRLHRGPKRFLWLKFSFTKQKWTFEVYIVRLGLLCTTHLWRSAPNDQSKPKLRHNKKGTQQEVGQHPWSHTGHQTECSEFKRFSPSATAFPFDPVPVSPLRQLFRPRRWPWVSRFIKPVNLREASWEEKKIPLPRWVQLELTMSQQCPRLLLWPGRVRSAVNGHH